MKTFSTLTLLSILIISTVSLAQKTEVRYNLSSKESQINWMAKDANSEYSGSMKVKNGYVTLKDKKVTSAVVFVDSKSFECTKCGSAENAQKLTEFIKSSKFLNTDNMDYAVFKMYESKPLENSKDGNYFIKGNLSIIAFSNEISFPVFMEVKKGKLIIEGSFPINRDIWNLKNPVEKDETVYSMESKIVLSFTLKSE
jgi:polyisoprenoid-binding protein YceI